MPPRRRGWSRREGPAGRRWSPRRRGRPRSSSVGAAVPGRGRAVPASAAGVSAVASSGWGSRRAASSSARLRASSSALRRASSSVLRRSASACSAAWRSCSASWRRACSSARARSWRSSRTASSTARARAAFSSLVSVRRTTLLRGAIEVCCTSSCGSGGALSATGTGAVAVFGLGAAFGPGAAVAPSAPLPRLSVRFLRTSTATARLRPWEKLCRTWPASTVFLRSSRPGRFSDKGLRCS